MTLRDIVEGRNVSSLVCCFSGGKDSLVSTHLVWNESEDLPLKHRSVLFVDTTVSLPGVVDYVKMIADRCGWNLVIVRPKKTFFDLAERWGMPTLRRRWCCYYLKLEPMFRYASKLPKYVMFVTGMRRDESSRRRNFNPIIVRRNPICGIHISFSPIFYWSDKQVHEYLRRHNLPLNPVAMKLGFSAECYCGVYAGHRELQKVAALYPEFMMAFMELEKRMSKGKYTFYAGGKKFRVKDLLAQKRITDYY